MVVTEMLSEIFRQFQGVDEPRASELSEDNETNLTGNHINAANGNPADNGIKPRHGILRQNSIR